MILLRSPSVQSLPQGLHQGAAIPGSLHHQTMPIAAMPGAAAGALQGAMPGGALQGAAMPQTLQSPLGAPTQAQSLPQLVSYASANGTITTTAALRPTLALTQSALNSQLSLKVNIRILCSLTRSCVIMTRYLKSSSPAHVIEKSTRLAFYSLNAIDFIDFFLIY